MAINLDKLSNDYEDALERARLLAEKRQQSLIQPLHFLYVILESDAGVASMLEKAGVAIRPLLESVSSRLNEAKGNQLVTGKRPTASRSLRELIEKSFEKMEARGAEIAEPLDFVMALTQSSDEVLRSELRGIGVTPETLARAEQTRAAARETLGE